ncbi:MAG: transcriptional regulator [Candidatus Marinimicrobia bacterium]|nr:transcriptional regulator [Candidatus Neomarinimicrobiota bacterium]
MRSELSWDIIKRFSGADQDCFSYQAVVKEYSSTDKIYLSKVLSGMVDKGMLIKLSRGLYHLVPTSADAENYIPDWHLVAKYIMKGKKYYIGYYSAMQVHGLITQPSLKEIIVTNHQVASSSRNIQGIEFQFVTHTSKRFFGYKNTWINQHNKVMVSDLEKTIVDAVTRPHLCGGMVEVGKAIYETRDKVSLDKLLKYLIQNESQAATKRYLFICDLVDLNWTSDHEGILQKMGTSYSLLDTSAPDQGRKDSRFGLKINVETDTIKNSIYA